VSSGDEDLDSAVEGLLQKSEREEATVLRAELVEFLKSAAAREQIEQAVRTPVENIVRAALADPKFQDQVRGTVIASLKPEIEKAIQAALNGVKVTISAEMQAQMRRDAEEVIGSARVEAQRGALAAANVPHRGLSQTDKLVLGAFVFVFLLATVGWWFLRRDRATPASVNPVVTETETVTRPLDETPPPVQPGSRLFERYQASLDAGGPNDLPSPSRAELSCVADALRQVERSSPLDVARLRALLNGCDALAARPRTASRIIAEVQAQLTEEARTGSCRALQPVPTDGLHGTKTSAALSTYVACTGPAGVPTSLNTLGDYAAVGVYFIDKRMRDAG
jgi:hypothetical protein